jgi:hypothetical protein
MRLAHVTTGLFKEVLSVSPFVRRSPRASSSVGESSETVPGYHYGRYRKDGDDGDDGGGGGDGSGGGSGSSSSRINPWATTRGTTQVRGPTRVRLRLPRPKAAKAAAAAAAAAAQVGEGMAVGGSTARSIAARRGAASKRRQRRRKRPTIDRAAHAAIASSSLPSSPSSSILDATISPPARCADATID